MTFPILIVGLYLGLLAISILIGSWAGHSQPVPDEARRVTDAAERAALGHLAGPAKISLGALLCLALLVSVVAQRNGGSVLWSAVAALFPPIVVATAVLYASRRTLKGAGQLVGVDGNDQRIAVTGRTIVSVVLCCDATVGVCLLGLHMLSSSDLGIARANQLVMTASSGVILAAAIFARASTTSILSVGDGTKNASAEPHAGSLALLVAKSFHSPLLRILSLVSISAIGHSALLAMTTGDGAESKIIWLYPHLLKLLGLFCLLFSGLVVRGADHEESELAWLRGAVVHFILMIAGAWSLSFELSDALSKSVPAGLTFLYVALAVSTFLSGRTNGNTARLTTSVSLARAPGAAVYLLLLLVLTVATSGANGPAVLPPLTFASLLLSGTLSLTPLAAVWLLSRDLNISGSSARSLAYGGMPVSPSPEVGAPNSFLGLLVPLVLAVGLSSLVVLGGGESQMSDLLFVGLGLASGALSLGSLVGLTHRASRPGMDSIRALLINPRDPDAKQLNFETAILICRKATNTDWHSTTAVLLGPILVFGVLSPLCTRSGLVAFSLGLSLSGVLGGVALEFFLSDETHLPRRALGTLGLVAGLAVPLWLLSAHALLT